MHDLVIRGGTLVDGRGGEPVEADVAVDGDRIVAVGKGMGRGAEEIDARGLIVTPGFVDLHTHYDAQATWDPVLAPSSWHGVTTAVMGNCGVGFAPARPDHRSWLIEIMENVEEIPRAVLEEGLRWDWETFPQYLDSLDARPHAIDLVTQAPYVALRGYVMGERADTGEAATPADIAEMARLLEEALKAGALGLACSRNDGHRLANGRVIPGSNPQKEELLAMCDAIRRAGRGVVQYFGSIPDWEGDLPFIRDMARRSGAAVHFLMGDTGWEARLAGIEAARADGLELVGHVGPRCTGNILQWRSSRHPFMDRPSIKAIQHLPWEQRLARLKDPAFRAQVLSEDNGSGEELLPSFSRIVYRGFERMFEIEAYPDYEPDPTTSSIAARAAATGQDPAALVYDVMMRDEGRGMIYLAISNYRTGDFSVVRKLITHDGIRVSNSDGGAHCLRVIDATSPTFMLMHWARDRSRGERLSLAQVVRMNSLDTAAAYGLHDRGIVAPGYLADLNVIDFDRLRLPAPYLAYDFPAGGGRLLQKAEGYVATVKSGRISFRDGEHTGAFAGGVVRGAQPHPARPAPAPVA